MAGQTQTIESTRRRARPETSAWLILVTFFLIFCAIVAGAGFAGWRYYTGAMERVEGVVVRVHARAGVTYRAKGSTKKVTPDVQCQDNPAGVTDACQTLNEGDRVQAEADAGYGQVASIKLPDQTQVDMWAHPTGVDLTLQKYQISRWTKQRQEVIFNQSAGYARYDIPSKDSQPYSEVIYAVEITNGISFALAPGGSYSVSVPHAEPGHPQALARSGKPLLVEVAVRTGSAEVKTPQGIVTARPGEKVEVDAARVASEAQPARWELIRDGTFKQWVTGGGPTESSGWMNDHILTDQSVTDDEKNGTFSIKQRCGPAIPDNCTESDYAYIGQFRRDGNQSKSYATAIKQSLDLDVSEYPSLVLNLWARVVGQSVPKAGEQGSECPLTIWLIYKQRAPSDSALNRYFCIYIEETEADLPQNQRSSEFIYTPVHQYQWYPLKYELRNYPSVKDAYYLETIWIYANGHDYVSEISGISLTATQQP